MVVEKFKTCLLYTSSVRMVIALMATVRNVLLTIVKAVIVLNALPTIVKVVTARIVLASIVEMCIRDRPWIYKEGIALNF